VAPSGEAVYLVDVAAGGAEGGVVAADGFFVGTFEQAAGRAFGVVVELELPDAELAGPRAAGVVGDQGDPSLSASNPGPRGGPFRRMTDGEDCRPATPVLAG
jgi:hypothetical protein